MTKFAPIALFVTLASFTAAASAETTQQVRETASATAAAPAVAVNAGKMLYAPNGSRLAAIYRVTSAGDVQIILNSRLFTIPASTLSDVGGKVTTSLTKTEINRR